MLCELTQIVFDFPCQHTDIKSDNVMVSFTDDGSVRIHFIDFGRAQSLASLDDQFSEKASVEEMQCRRMRLDNKWGIEQEWFGFCKSIYLLLVGENMEGEYHFKEPENWAKYEETCLPHLSSRAGRRVFTKWETLWIPFFLTLLNYDSRKDDYRNTVNELRKKLENGVPVWAQSRTKIFDVKTTIEEMDRLP